MKNLKIFLLLIIAALFFSGCYGIENNRTKADKANRFTIVTSFYPIYLSVQNIAKDIPGVNVVNMTKPQTGCLHDYQLTPDDLVTLENAEIFVINGAGMESFLGKVLEQLPNIKIIKSAEGINLVKNPGSEDYNPHIWVSITDYILQVKNISREVQKLDKPHAQAYQKNTDAYVKRLNELRTKMHNQLDNINNKNIVTFHEAFPYFAREFGLKVVSVIEREPGSEPSAVELIKIIDTIKASKVKAVFIEPQYSAKSAEVISRETGVKLYHLDPVVTGPDNPASYINIMENNLEILKEALK